MMPAWEEATEKLGASEEVQLAMVDCTAEKALAERLQVMGYPTLLSFEADGAVVEYEGDRSAESLITFAQRKRPGLLSRRRGYLASDGSMEPSRLDALLRLPHDVREIVHVAVDMSPFAAALVAIFCALAGAIAALACKPRTAPQFLVVECPPGVKAGQRFDVEVSEARRFRAPRARVVTIQAPAGIVPGQSFFVPLVPPQSARAVAMPAKKTK